MKGTKVSKEIKISMESKYNIISAVWAILGVLFWISALGMFIMRDNMPQIPRADIAYIGFLIVGAIFLIIAIAIACMAKDKNAIVEENDERSEIILGKAAFLIQTVLFGTALFLFCFMGYVNAPVILTLMCLMAISIFIYFIFSLYYNQRM
ncbi:MAG: hypothetical protein HFG39_09915 [Lachnospiraceae bacterium]|nr:hypothetical protein [Lachnospiraceae bacterium]